ncbi:MAG: PilZ domain-containing protein [Proteobacteria bacterium]|nr:PilZ domain-containing protein [Pseudomonadota bacterium]
MKKRPLAIVLIALFYVLEPFGTLIHAAYINNMTLFGGDGIISHLIWPDWVILCLFPVVGAGIYMMKKWGWYLFLSFSVLLISYNIFVYKYLNPNYSLEIVMFFIIITTVISAFFLRKNVYAPFFNPRLRWWEIATRYRAPLNTVLVTKNGVMTCKIIDISETGCFVDLEGEISIGSSVTLEFLCDGVQISCIGTVVNKRSGTNGNYRGYGIQFQAMSQEMKKKFRQLLWYFERIGLEDRKDFPSVIGTSNDASWQKYTFFNQMEFKLKVYFRSIIGRK